jgi:metal-sulfur cluster biosynthetic enzyme
MSTNDDQLNSVTWSIDEQDTLLAQKLRIGFRDISDPEIGMDIIQLGLIRDVRLGDDDSLIVKMLLTTPFCPYGPAMLESTRKKAAEVSEKETFMEMSTEVWDFSMMEDGGTAADWGLF